MVVATLLFGFGFGLLDDIGATATAVLAIVLFIAQRYFSEWWLSRFKFGPMEWLWRSATFLEIQSFKK